MLKPLFMFQEEKKNIAKPFTWLKERVWNFNEDCIFFKTIQTALRTNMLQIIIVITASMLILILLWFKSKGNPAITVNRMKPKISTSLVKWMKIALKTSHILY